MFEVSYSLVLKRGITRGLRTLRREHRWKSTLGALCGIFVVVQLLIIAMLGLQTMQTILESRTDLRIELQPTATDNDIQDFYSALRALPYIQKTQYITKEQAYEQAQKLNPELVSFLEEFNFDNPFADIIGVTLTSLEAYNQFASFTEEQRWSSVVNPEFLSVITEQEKRVGELLQLTRSGRMLTAIILGITALSLLFITVEFVRSRALSRSDEVLVERLAGATPLAIVTPFVAEAVVLFWAAVLCTTAGILAVITLLPTVVPALELGGILQEFRVLMTSQLYMEFPLIIAIELLCIPFIITLGVWLGIKSQITSPRISFSL